MNYKAKVFLSGGFKSNWQQKVVSELGSQFIFFNPREHGLDEPEHYTTWDIHFVKECDIFFAYMEASNPSGYGLAFELGLAYAWNKTIILIDERSVTDQNFARYFKILHKPSGVVVKTIESGIEILRRFSFYKIEEDANLF